MYRTPNATIHLVTRHETVKGHVVKRHDVPSKALPWRIAKRMTAAHAIGLAVVRGLTRNSDVIAVEVSDGSRTLAQWRLMDNGLGYTGTSESHPLTPRKVRWTGEGWN